MSRLTKETEAALYEAKNRLAVAEQYATGGAESTAALVGRMIVASAEAVCHEMAALREQIKLTGGYR